MTRYEQVPHTADLAARIYGKDLKELFGNAAFAMFDMMADLSGTDADHTIDIEVKAEDPESLLIKWLNELLFLSFDLSLIFSGIKILKVNDSGIKARVSGYSYAGKETLLKKEIKAATYHDVRIKETPRGFEVTVVFDV